MDCPVQAAGASTGTIRYRILKPQGGRFDQTNDYSYQEQPADRSQNSRVVVLLGEEVVWGTAPTGAGARVAARAEPGTDLAVRVLGNPVVGDQVEVEVSGAPGQALQVRLVDTQGRLVSQDRHPSAAPEQRFSLKVNGQPGVYLLQVSTPTQRQTVKVLKAE